MPMEPIPAEYTVDMPVVRIAGRGEGVLSGKVTRITKTRLTATFDRPGSEPLTTQWYNRGWNSDPLALTEHGNSSYAWSRSATLVPADDPRVADAKVKVEQAKVKAAVHEAVRKFNAGPTTPDAARALRTALTTYITKAEELNK